MEKVKKMFPHYMYMLILGYRESNPGLLREQSLLRSESQRCYRYTIPDFIVCGSDRGCC